MEYPAVLLWGKPTRAGGYKIEAYHNNLNLGEKDMRLLAKRFHNIVNGRLWH